MAWLCAVAAMVMGMAGVAAAEPAASREEAVKLVQKAVQFAKQNGREKAVEEFNKPAGPFVDRELFIVAIDLNGNLLANGANRKMVGKNLIDIRDVDGRYFTRDEIALAKSQGRGWVDFKWPHPLTGKIEPRSVYLERVDDYLILAGVYGKK